MKFLKNKFLIDDILNSEHPSDFEYSDDFSLLILRLPYIKNEKVDVFSYVFLFKDNKVFYFNRKLKDFEELGNMDNFYEFLDLRVDKILAKLNNFHIQIAKIEDDMYDGNIDKNFTKKWLSLKKDLVSIERLMGHALIAYERFLNFHKLHKNFAFRDLKEHFNRAFTFSKSAIEKLDYLYEFYRAKQDEKMNIIMFVLTILSGIFLPLTLITGFFGMNTGGLPWTNDPYGTIKAVFVAVILEVPIVFVIWKMMKN